MKLEDVLSEYGVPDQSIVGKLPRGGITLDFVGHAEITKILIEIDPNWSWEPVAWTADGRPAINVVNGNAVMWGRLTVLGQTRLGVGTAKHDKPDLDKELIGDFLRNAAMRFGICLSLWSKSEWEDQPESSKPALKPKAADAPKPVDTSGPVANFKVACKQSKIDPDELAKEVGIADLNHVTPEELDKLRVAFRARVAAKSQAEPKPQSAVTTSDKPRLSLAEITTLGINKGFSKEERLQMASDIAKRKVSKLEQLSVSELNELIDLLEAARG